MSRNAKRPVAALMYDFDKTLCTKDMQEYSFIPGLGISAHAFWEESARLSERGMDRILAYMYLMLKKAREADKPVRRENFVSDGPRDRFFPRRQGLGSTGSLHTEPNGTSRLSTTSSRQV